MLTPPEPWPNAQDKLLRSERYLAATHSSMRADVIQAVNNTKEIDPAKLESLRQAYVGKRKISPIRSAPEERAAYLEYTLPIYRALREMGYSHYDLWA